MLTERCMNSLLETEKEVPRVSFRTAIETIAPQVRGTIAPDLLARFVLAMEPLVTPDEGLVLTGSGACVLLCESSEARNVANKAKAILQALPKGSSMVDSEFQAIFNNLSLGPDIDIKYRFDPTGIYQGVLGERSLIFPPPFVFRKLTRHGPGHFTSKDDPDISLNLSSRPIPIYVPHLKHVRNIQREVFQINFSRRGEPLMQCHLAPDVAFEGKVWNEQVYLVDARFGPLMTLKARQLRIPVVFPQRARYANLADQLSFLPIIYPRETMSSPDFLLLSGRNKQIFESSDFSEYLVIFLISVARSINLALVTRTKENLKVADCYFDDNDRQKNFEYRFGYQTIRKKLDKYEDWASTVSTYCDGEAGREITTQVVCGILTNRELYFNLAEEIGLLPYLVGGKDKEQIQRMKILAERLENGEASVSEFNEFAQMVRVG